MESICSIKALYGRDYRLMCKIWAKRRLPTPHASAPSRRGFLACGIDVPFRLATTRSDCHQQRNQDNWKSLHSHFLLFFWYSTPLYKPTGDSLHEKLYVPASARHITTAHYEFETLRKWRLPGDRPISWAAGTPDIFIVRMTLVVCAEKNRSLS